MWQVKKSGGWLVRSGFILSVHTFQIVSVSLQTIKISCSTFIALISQQFIISTIPSDTLWYLCSVLLRFYWIYIILMVLSSTIKSWKWAREFYTSHILTLSSAAKLRKKCLTLNSFHSIVLYRSPYKVWIRKSESPLKKLPMGNQVACSCSC